jgi:cytochrome P450
MSALVEAEDQGDKLTEQELISTCILLLVAGHETTTNLIGNGMLALFRNPDQLQALKNNPALGRSAIEELLRYDSPVQLTSRQVLHDTEFNGQMLKRGMQVSFMLGAANHDPAVFNEPGKLDITRDPNPHLSFSNGIHYCLGAPLARMEGLIAIQTLLSRAPEISLINDNPTYRDTWVLRGLQALPVKLG